MSYRSNRCTGFTTRTLLVTYWPFGLGAVSGGCTEGMGPGTSSTQSLRISRSWIPGMERTNLPDAVLTSTVLTTPSKPGNSCVITPSGHLNRGCWSSCTRTTEPSRRSHFPEHHAMEASSWYNHWTKFPRIFPGATVALQSGELGHCQMPLG